MAGLNAAFNAATVRAALKGAMQMGASTDPANRVIFYMPTTTAYDKTVDGEGLPLDPTAEITSDPAPVSHQVDCAVEVDDEQNQATGFGSVTPTRVVLTLLDVDYAVIAGFDYVTIRGKEYRYQHEEPDLALFDMGVHRIHVEAKTQS